MLLTLAFVVDRLDEPRELGRGGTDGAERFLVVHAHGADQADGTERAMDEAVTRPDECDLAQRRMVELLADPHERTPRVERRLAEDLEQRSALLDELEQVPVRVELLGAQLAEQVGGAADIEALLRGDELRERGAQRSEERQLARTQARILEAAAQEPGAGLQPRPGLVQVLNRPLHEPRTARLLEGAVA